MSVGLVEISSVDLSRYDERFPYFLLLTSIPVYHGSLIGFLAKVDFLCCTDSYVSRTYKLSARASLFQIMCFVCHTYSYMECINELSAQVIKLSALSSIYLPLILPWQKHDSLGQDQAH